MVTTAPFSSKIYIYGISILIIILIWEIKVDDSIRKYSSRNKITFFLSKILYLITGTGQSFHKGSQDEPHFRYLYRNIDFGIALPRFMFMRRSFDGFQFYELNCRFCCCIILHRIWIIKLLEMYKILLNIDLHLK